MGVVGPSRSYTRFIAAISQGRLQRMARLSVDGPSSRANRRLLDDWWSGESARVVGSLSFCMGVNGRWILHMEKRPRRPNTQTRPASAGVPYPQDAGFCPTAKTVPANIT